MRWTLRRPFRPLGYHAARRCSSGRTPRWGRVAAVLPASHGGRPPRRGSGAHHRRALDFGSPVASTTQLYVRSTAEDVIESALAHHRRAGSGKRVQIRRRRDTGRRAWMSCSAGTGRDRRHREKTAGRRWQLSVEALALWRKCPTAHGPGQRPATRQSRARSWPRWLAAVPGRDVPGPLQPEAGPGKGAGLAGAAPGRTWQDRWTRPGRGRRPPRLRRTLLDEQAAAGTSAAGRADLQDPWPWHGRAYRCRRSPRPGVAMATLLPMRIADEMGARDPPAWYGCGVPQDRESRGGRLLLRSRRSP